MKNRIKILVDGRWFDSYYSGVTTYLKGIYNVIARDPDFDITIIGGNSAQLANEFPHHVTLMELRSNSNSKRLFWDIPGIIKKYGFDYAHFQYICPLIKQCKYIVTLHDLLFLDFKGSFPVHFIVKRALLFYLSAKRADILLTVSDFSRERIAHHFKIPKDKIHVTPNGVLERYRDIDQGDEFKRNYRIGRYILFVSRIEPRKNHLALIKAFLELQLYKEYTLVFVGKKTIPVREMDRYIDTLPMEIRNRIVFIDKLSEQELKSCYEHASLFVYPSLSEGFGIPPLEAISLGAKTICSNTTALRDFDFLSAYQFAPNNASELKSRMLYALHDANYPMHEFQTIIRARYNWENIGEKLKKILVDDRSGD